MNSENTPARSNQAHSVPPVSRNRRGAMMVLIAVVLVILFVSAAFAIDIAYMHSTRAELRTATDAAARAGSEALGRLQNTESAIQAALDIASRNEVAGKPLQLDRQDIVLGSHLAERNGKFRFVEGGNPVTAIRVLGRRDATSPSGSVPLFFGPLLGRSTFEPKQLATAARLDRDIALVLDISGSMNGQGRISGLRNALTVFLNELEDLPQEEVCSLTVYNHAARRVQPMTSELSLLQDAFNRERARGATAIGLALRAGIQSIKQDPGSRPFAFKEILLMTDGNHNHGVHPLDVVREAVAAGITVHTITFGRGANRRLMQQVAEIGNGKHLHADSNIQLTEVFRDIANQVPVILIE